MNQSTQIDRMAPTRRPDGCCRGYQNWRSLLFMHWAVDVETLRALVPAPLELDVYEGKAYVGVVPFVMQAVRPRWCPEMFSFNFLETNVRTYVCHRGRPGVYFFSLDAASRIAVWAARAFWSLPYFHARMSFTQPGDEILYQSRRSSSDVVHKVRYRLGELLGSLHPESLEFFFLERYLLFAEHQGQLYMGQVHHAPYPAQAALVLELEDQLLRAASLGDFPGMPAFTHYAAGVDVEIFDLKPVATV
jgi:uncharacterized protein